MHIHIIGICGTFMGGIALLAREAGHQVSGCDANVYPPMSTQLEEQGITLTQGFEPDQLPSSIDIVVVGNVMSRGNPLIEAVLNRGIPYTSGPQWLEENILQGRWVLAVSGTHGKTTTSSMLAWVLEDAGLHPGYLVGGVPENFGLSARLGKAPFFVVEADEYDTAFFDKRSKFVHYHPRTLVLNNLEFDHADIFADLNAIKTQFHHQVRTVPSEGLIIAKANDDNVADVLTMGCWTPVEGFAGSKAQVNSIGQNVNDHGQYWYAQNCSADGRQFDVYLGDELQGTVTWPLMGPHNVENALATIAAARHAGVPVAHSIRALQQFKNVKRRLELRAEVEDIRVYDDFAHHPTAIASTLEGLRGFAQSQRIIAVLEPRSNTMRMGVHKDMLADSLALADVAVLYQAQDLPWKLTEAVETMGRRATVLNNIDQIVEFVVSQAQPGDHVLVMSNGAFGGIHEKLIAALKRRSGS